MRLLVSACLLGVGCRYDGQSNQLPQLEQLLKQHTCIPVCAELFGGLPTPRVPAERQGNRVVTRDGDDVTEAFVRKSSAWQTSTTAGPPCSRSAAPPAAAGRSTTVPSPKP